MAEQDDRLSRSRWYLLVACGGLIWRSVPLVTGRKRVADQSSCLKQPRRRGQHAEGALAAILFGCGDG